MIFEDVEEVCLGPSDLPKSVRVASIGPGGPTTRIGGSHTQALAWIGAGWKTSDVDLDIRDAGTFTPKNSEFTGRDGPVTKSTSTWCSPYTMPSCCTKDCDVQP